MPQVHLMAEGGMYHLHFWCDLYNPHRLWYPKETYNKGEEICKGCSFLVNGVMYRAKFQCTREPTTTYLSRFAVPRGTGGFFNSHPADIPVKEQKDISDLFGWLYGIEAKRKPTKKIAKKIKERDDSHGTVGGTSSGLLQDNTIREEVKIFGEKAEPSQGTQDESIQYCGGSIPDRRMPGLPEGTNMRDDTAAMPGKIDGATVQGVRSESGIPCDRIPEVGSLPNVQEQNMKEIYDESYGDTTAHACITCKCGTKVWYGCGVKQLTRPKYCPECEKKEKEKITESYRGKVDTHELYRILEWELRRAINK